jgi:serine/threonine protein kinase
MINWSQYNKAELRSFAVQTYREGGGSRPDVFLLEKEGFQAVLKDHDGMDKWFARVVGPLLAWREAKAMVRLEEVLGIPKLLSKPDARSLLMEHVDARQIVHVDGAEYESTDYFLSLKDLIERMHAAGVAHGDLRSPTNALIDSEGNAALVDFVASINKGADWNIVNHYFFEKMSLVDFSAITKLKKRIAPELLDDSDIESADIAGRKGMLFRKMGQWIRIISRKLFSDKVE